MAEQSEEADKVVLVGVVLEGRSLAEVEESLDELALLVDTAGGVEVARLVQRRHAPDAATFVGSGKAKEIQDEVLSAGADVVVFDAELSPAQQRNLEDVVGVRTLDRTGLILNIFAQHAGTLDSSRSAAGGAGASGIARAQVELAQLEYALPRLRGQGRGMSQQRAGIRQGAGETQLELDRRKLRNRISQLRRDLKSDTRNRELTRTVRRDAPVPAVALVGYTNAGKSSLLKAVTGADVYVANQLFATLDSTVRQARTPEGRVITLSDTVGFVRHLPHQLVDAFRSTLEEVVHSDLLLHVVDASAEHPHHQVEAVRDVLREIGAAGLPEVLVLNKVDLIEPGRREGLALQFPDAVLVSATTGEGLKELLTVVQELLPGLVEVDTVIPYTKGALVDRIHRDAEILLEEHVAEGTHLRARVHPALAAQLPASPAGVER